LLYALVVKLVEGNEHECSALAGRRWRLDQKVLFAPSLPSALLHGTHSIWIDTGCGASRLVINRDRRDVIPLHVHAFILRVRSPSGALPFRVIFVYISNSFSSRSVSLRNRRPM